MRLETSVFDNYIVKQRLTDSTPDRLSIAFCLLEIYRSPSPSVTVKNDNSNNGKEEH